MPNNYGTNRASLRSKYCPVLDEVYKEGSITSILDGPEELAEEGANANELIIPSLEMDGQGDYSRDTGYPMGYITMTKTTYRCPYDRGRMFQIDAVDNADSADQAFGRLAGEYIRQKVNPEIDAWRFASYCGRTGIGAATAANITTAAQAIAALRTGLQYMDDHEVPDQKRYLFVRGAVLDLIEDMDTTKSAKVLDRFEKIIRVPGTRFYGDVRLYDGISSGEEAGGYAKAPNAKDLNFMIIQKDSIIQFTKHKAPKIITPEQNQDADAWKYGYRIVGIANIYNKKLAGVYKMEAAS